MPHTQQGNTLISSLLGLFIIALLGTLAYLQWRGDFHPNIDEKTAHYAIVLSNGQSIFAHVDRVSAGQIELSDVFYIQSRMNPETKEVQNALIRRGKIEWHSPKKMLVNGRSILIMEPVDPESKVAKLIAEQKAAEK